MMKKNNIVLSDFNPGENWVFSNQLEKDTGESWKLYICENWSVKTGILGLLRYLRYFSFPLKIFLTRGSYKDICAWQQFYGIVFAFYCRLFRAKKINKLIIMTFIYQEKKGIFGKLYYNFIKYSIDNQYVDALICFSKNEIEEYSKIFNVNKSKFYYCTLGAVDKNLEKSLSNYESSRIRDRYIFSVGRSNRDYDSLIKFVNNTEYTLKIACDTLKDSKKNNIIISSNIHGEEYFKTLRNAFCVIICLKDNKISSGQLVLMHSYMFGVPVIITPNNSLEEYAIDGETALMVPKTKQDILCAIKQLCKDRNLYNKLSQNGRKLYEDKYSIEALAHQVSKVIVRI